MPFARRHRKKETMLPKISYYYEMDNAHFWQVDYLYQGSGKFVDIHDYQCAKKDGSAL
ncbi:MAG: hypothetical protein ACLTAQ_04415 [Longicatena caecimuris]|uniref:hypothetical protein n=1 Tax=Longicatena caecimuris TaxID=1796635 RepID=UPI003991A5CB